VITRTLFRVIALLAACVPAVSRAQHIPHLAGADSARAHVGAMATGLLTTANPALLGRRYTEGYLTQPNIMGDAAIGMTGMDLETAARNGIATLTIVFNNSVMAAWCHCSVNGELVRIPPDSGEL
jgi:thiamine pyrophosphate-dependent acetolactate synthase large subunit-like protein